MGTFPPTAVQFLSDLRANNDRTWFKANQATFEQVIREPAMQFARDMGDWLASQGLPYVCIDKKVGGSVAKIQRDVRFSKDKTPYHDHVTVFFPHKQAGPEVATPAFGIRFGPEEVGIGGGLWTAPTPVLNKVRDAIVADPDGWVQAKGKLSISAEQLKTAPRGYDKEHPLVDDLRMKGYMAHVPLTHKDLERDLVSVVAKKGAPLFHYMAWLEPKLVQS